MTYNLTGISDNATGMLSFTRAVSDNLMFGWLGTLLLIAVFFISLIAFIRNTGETNKSLAAASFIAFGLSLVLRAALLVSDFVVFVSLILCGAIIALTWKSN